MKIDMHIHTSYSVDGRVNPKDVLKIAKKKGMTAIAITDHNEIKGAIKAKKLRIIPVIQGIEISSSAGHILGYGVDCKIKRDLTVEETIEEVHDCGGIAVIAHPFRLWSGLGEKVARASVLLADGIEIFNGRCTARNNARAKSLADEFKKAYTAGSDAHFADEIGKVMLDIDCEPDNFVDCVVKIKGTPVGTARNPVETLRYVKKAVLEWAGRGFQKI